MRRTSPSYGARLVLLSLIYVAVISGAVVTADGMRPWRFLVVFFCGSLSGGVADTMCRVWCHWREERKQEA